MAFQHGLGLDDADMGRGTRERCMRARVQIEERGQEHSWKLESETTGLCSEVPGLGRYVMPSRSNHHERSWFRISDLLWISESSEHTR